MDQYHIALDYGNSNWDIRHRFVGSGSYTVPRLFAKNGIAHEVVDGWQTDAIVTLQTGMPIFVNLGFDQANVSEPRGHMQRPNFIHQASAHCGLKDYIRTGNATSCIDTTAYAIPDAYTFGNSTRNSLHGPGYANVNFSLFKSFPIWERAKFQFRAEAVNLFNHPSAGTPNSEIDTGWQTGQSENDAALGFGTITSTQSTPRSIQLAGKFIF